MVKLPTLYSRTSTGAIQRWDITVEKDYYFTSFGQVDGKIQTTKPTVCIVTNEGRANQRTPEEQALFEAKALWKKKQESGYYELVDDIDQVGFVEPMLAKNFDDYRDKIKFPVYSSSKLDGIRCIVTKDGMFSRNGKIFNSCPHIREELQYFFNKYPDVVLDGELYCDKLNNNFNKICSLVKKSKPNTEDLLESKITVQYWIYDTVNKEQFTTRFKFIQENIKETSNIKIVYSVPVNNFNELDDLYEQYLSAGFEGQMVRINAVYENKRSKNLLKRKEFQDREYIILDILEGEGNRSGLAGAMVFKNENSILFNSNIKGDRSFLKELLINKNQYIGKEATIKFFNLTPNFIPRFPFVVSIRDFE